MDKILIFAYICIAQKYSAYLYHTIVVYHEVWNQSAYILRFEQDNIDSFPYQYMKIMRGNPPSRQVIPVSHNLIIKDEIRKLNMVMYISLAIVTVVICHNNSLLTMYSLDTVASSTSNFVITCK